MPLYRSCCLSSVEDSFICVVQLALMENLCQNYKLRLFYKFLGKSLTEVVFVVNAFNRLFTLKLSELKKINNLNTDTPPDSRQQINNLNTGTSHADQQSEH